jgi:hypothetical protein
VHLFAIVLVLVIGGMFVGGSLLLACRSQKKSRRKKALTACGGVLMAIGGLGFFGTALSASGGLRWLPSNFEWPVGFASGVLIMTDGKQVVPLTAAGRIQVYDSEWRFLRGWYVDAGAGIFKIRPKDDKIEVITARGRMRYLYTIDGSLLSQDSYAPQSYADFPAHGPSAVVPTRWWLWLFSHPFFSWATGAAGMLLLILIDKGILGKNRVW